MKSFKLYVRVESVWSFEKEFASIGDATYYVKELAIIDESCEAFKIEIHEV